MKTLVFLVSIIISAAQPVMAQTEGKTIYPLVVSFQSKCCGVPTDSAIRNFIRSFKIQYKIKRITAYHIGPMGREGEYYLAFKLNELNKKQVGSFISKIKNIKPLPTDRGLFTFNENMEIDPAGIPKRTAVSDIVF